ADDEDARGCGRRRRSRDGAEAKREQNRLLHACKDCIRERVSGLEREGWLRHRSSFRVVMKKLLLILAIGLLLPGTGRAGTVVTPDVTMIARDVPLAGRELQAAAAPIRFDMLGLHWQGPGTVAYRTRSLDGRWSAWRTADADLPATKPPWHFGNLDWTGEATAVQYRASGVSRLRAFYLDSRVTSAPKRRLSLAGSPAIV